MTRTHDSSPRSNEDSSTSTSGIDPGKHSRSSPLPVQRKAGAPAPAATAFQSEFVPTRVGANLGVEEPSPSWPLSFWPHAQRLPSVLTARV